jgi:hypothetical protein
MGDECRVRGSQKVLHERRVSRSVVSLGTNFAAMHRMLSSCEKIPWHVPYDSRTMLQTSWFIRHQSSRIASRTFATFSVVVPVEGHPERSSSSTDIHPFFKRLNHPLVCVWPRALSQNASLSTMCFRSRLAEFQAEFVANRLLLHIIHFSRSVRSQNSTNTTSQKYTEQTRPHSRTPLSRVVYKGYRLRYLAAHKQFSRGIPISGT